MAKVRGWLAIKNKITVDFGSSDNILFLAQLVAGLIGDCLTRGE